MTRLTPACLFLSPASNVQVIHHIASHARHSSPLTHPKLAVDMPSPIACPSSALAWTFSPRPNELSDHIQLSTCTSLLARLASNRSLPPGITSKTTSRVTPSLFFPTYLLLCQRLFPAVLVTLQPPAYYLFALTHTTKDKRARLCPPYKGRPS